MRNFGKERVLGDNYALKSRGKDKCNNHIKENSGEIKHSGEADLWDKADKGYAGYGRRHTGDNKSSAVRKYFGRDIDREIIDAFDKEINKAFAEMPRLRNYIRCIGNRSEMSRHMRAEAYNWLIKYYIKSGINYEDAKKSANKHITQFSKITMSQDAIAMFTTFKSKFEDANKKIFYKYKGIYLNDKWNRAEKLNKSVKLLSGRGMFSRGSGDIRQIIVHEIAHAICEMLRLDKHPYMRKLYSKYRYRISKYASKDVAEFIAEAWAEYKTGDNPRDICRKVGIFIMSEYTKQSYKY